MKQKDLVILFGTSCFVVIAWIGFSLYNSWATSTVNKVQLVEVKPIDGTFDTATLEAIKTRQTVYPLYTLTTGISPTPAIASSQGKLIPALPITTRTPTPLPARSSAGGQI